MKKRDRAMLMMGSVVLSSCYRSWDIPNRELQKLNGYQEPAQVQLSDKDGQSVLFDRDTELDFGRRQPGGPDPKGRFLSVKLEGPRLEGVTLGGGLSFDLPRMQETFVARRYDPGRTAALAIPLTILGAAGIAAIVGLSFLKAHPIGPKF